MANEVLQSIFFSLKNKPTGSIIGAIGGYVICKKVIKTDRWIAIVPVIVIGALVGSTIEYKLTEKPISQIEKEINVNIPPSK